LHPRSASGGGGVSVVTDNFFAIDTGERWLEMPLLCIRLTRMWVVPGPAPNNELYARLRNDVT